MLYIAYDTCYAHHLPQGHRFPMLKYELIPEQLLHEGCITSNNLFAPTPCTDAIVLLTHTAEYLNKLHQLTLTPQEQRRIGFPQSAELTRRELIITQGTIDCALKAMEHGCAMNVAGGTHHAFADRGEGFCLLNDMATASNYLLANQLVQKILIVDLDVHQGNGTASLMAQEPRVCTFSMHGAHNYPFHKEQSDVDVPLLDGTDTGTYLNLLAEHLPVLLDTHQPDLVFYLSGVDILDTDRYGKLKVTLEGCRQRDAYVFQQLHQRNIPVAVAMGGGYSPDVRTIVTAHCNTFKEALALWG